MLNLRFRGLVMVFTLLWIVPAGIMAQPEKKLDKAAMSKLVNWKNPVKEWRYPAKMIVDSVKVSEETKNIKVFFPGDLLYNPVREENLAVFETSIRTSLGRKFRNYDLNLITGGFEMEELIPNIFRKQLPVDTTRLPGNKAYRPVLIKRTDFTEPVKGLNERYK